MTTIALNPSHTYIEEGRLWYDTKKGVEQKIKTLDGLLHLRYERYQAGYIRKEKLNELYVLGDYFFDSVGNCLVSNGSIKKIFQKIPNVLTHKEYWNFMKENFEEKMNNIFFSYNQSIPSETIQCPICKKGWSIENVYDVVTRKTSEMVKLTDFIGMSLGEVIEQYSLKKDAHYHINYEPFLQNDRFKDNTPWTLNPKTESEKTMVKNRNGWVGEKDGINDNYVIQKDDIVHFEIIHHLHAECNNKDLKIKEIKSFKEIFTKAGFLKIEMKSIKNEYCGCDHCAPWFEVTTEFGTFKIGWRKRVINIDWAKVNNKKESLIGLFVEENVTKDNHSIHAWGNEKAVEYLSKIVSYLKS